MKTSTLFKWLAILLIASQAFSCSRKTVPVPAKMVPGSTAKVNFLEESDGTITARAIGVGSTQDDAINDAEKNTFDVILFRGLPNSDQKTALIGTDESEEKVRHKEYFKQFYLERRYKTFLMSSVPTSSLVEYEGGEKSIGVDIKINLISLRKDLEQNDIIRKFGF